MDGGVSEEAFRAEPRAWFAAAPRHEGLRGYGGTPGLADVPAGREWHRTLAEAGYACLHRPTEHGGRGASVLEQVVFAEEAAKARGSRSSSTSWGRTSPVRSSCASARRRSTARSCPRSCGASTCGASCSRKQKLEV